MHEKERGSNTNIINGRYGLISKDSRRIQKPPIARDGDFFFFLVVSRFQPGRQP